MVVLVTGGSGSGKSEYAENRLVALRACEADAYSYYLATMEPFGEEGAKRIARHRKMRADKGFETIECYTNLQTISIIKEKSFILLECMSNLVANELYSESGCAAYKKDCVSHIREGLLHCMKYAKDMIIVTNEVHSDGICYEKDTMHYIEILGAVNQMVAELADEVIEVVYGIPLLIKNDNLFVGSIERNGLSVL